MGNMQAAELALPAGTGLKCRLCTFKLNPESDDLALRLCECCIDRPEAKRLGLALPEKEPVVKFDPHAGLVRGAPAKGVAATGDDPQHEEPARDFTPAERALAGKMHRLVSRESLLEMLNERLAFDLGPDAAPYKMEQLQAMLAEIGVAAAATPAANPANSRVALRRLLAQARRDGVLDLIDENVIDTFAVVFSLSPKQVLALKDIVLENT